MDVWSCVGVAQDFAVKAGGVGQFWWWKAARSCCVLVWKRSVVGVEETDGWRIERRCFEERDELGAVDPRGV